MKQTLLEMTQRILESMKSDEVNSISDTLESATVANIIQESYYDILSTVNLPEHFTLFELDASTTATPILMTLPTDVFDLSWLKYNIRETADTTDTMSPISFITLEEYLRRQDSLSDAETYVDTMVFTEGTYNHTIKFRNDQFPSYCTVVDDFSILFESHKATIDDPLQSTKTQAYGQSHPTLTLADASVPDLDARQFQLLYNKAKSQAFIELKQASNPISEKRERNHMLKSQRYKDNFHGLVDEYKDNTMNMGRRKR